METSKITNEVYTKMKKRMVPKLILDISLFTIAAIAYTVFVSYCLYSDLTFERVTTDITATYRPSLSLIIWGISFYVLYVVVMFVLIKKIKKSVNSLRHFYLNDHEAVNLVTDDFNYGFGGRPLTVGEVMESSRPALIYTKTFLKWRA